MIMKKSNFFYFRSKWNYTSFTAWAQISHFPALSFSFQWQAAEKKKIVKGVSKPVITVILIL
jgi:hypothetical protein